MDHDLEESVMREFIPIARPVIGDDEIAAAADVLRSGMLAQGEAVRLFEEEFAEYLGAKNAIAVSNGTAALDLALRALRLEPGGEVISPAFTFIATANCALFQGLRPAFADVDPRTFNIDPDDLLERITPKTRAVIAVHLYGQPFDVRAVQEICGERGIALIEDCAQAHGAEFMGRKAGSFSTGCFSFYPTKNMTTGEGGMVTTDDDALAERLRLLRSHGDAGKYNHIILGYNYRMTNLQGAIGRVQLGKLEQFTARRIANAAVLSREIRADGLTTPFCMDGVRHVYHQYVLRVEDDAPARRERLMQFLQSRGIGSAVHYPKAVYEQPLYREMGYEKGTCPVSEDVARRVLSLPVHPSLSESDLHRIAETVNSFEG